MSRRQYIFERLARTKCGISWERVVGSRRRWKSTLPQEWGQEMRRRRRGVNINASHDETDLLSNFRFSPMIEKSRRGYTRVTQAVFRKTSRTYCLVFDSFNGRGAAIVFEFSGVDSGERTIGVDILLPTGVKPLPLCCWKEGQHNEYRALLEERDKTGCFLSRQTLRLELGLFIVDSKCSMSERMGCYKDIAIENWVLMKQMICSKT